MTDNPKPSAQITDEELIENSKYTILHLCADTGSDSKPWKDAGFNVILVGRNIGVENFIPPEDVYGVIANPVCTEFSIAQGRHIIKDYEKGMFLVRHCQRIIDMCNPSFWCIENPATGKLREYLGEPTMTYEPWHYGSPWSKRTALWGEFIVPQRKYCNWIEVPKIEKLPIYQGRGKPSLAKMHYQHKKLIPEFECFDVDNDAEFRSLCSQKFAQAFYEANKPPTLLSLIND